MYQLSRFRRGKCQVARADHHGHQEISQRRRNRRHQEEEHHDDAVHGEELVVGFRCDQRALRLNQVQAHQHREKAADKEHESDRAEIEQRDALVVGGEQPGLYAVARVQIIDARFGRNFLPGHFWNDCGAHFPFVFLSSVPSDLT